MINCLHCGREFEPYKYNALKGYGKYCSRACGYASKRRNLTCECCGKAFSRPLSYAPKSKTVFCSLACRNEHYKSDKFLGITDGFRVYRMSQGYASIVLGRSQEKLLHVYLMEKHLGRCLEKNEHVHHINQDRLDNRIENLKIVSNCGEHQTEHAHIRLKALGGVPGKDKYCPKCQKVKSLDDFPSSRNMSDGKYGYCKKCACQVVAKAKAKRKKHG